jgi:DNA-binding CsgD family transcriptional regulator/PAS domain-containing protein
MAALSVGAELIDGIYDAVLQPEGWNAVLHQAMRVYRASSAALFVQNMKTRRPELAISIGVQGDRKTWLKFYDYYVFKNPVRIANLARPVGEPTASNLLMADREFEQLEYHRDFQKLAGCFYELATHLVRDERMLACFSIQRARKEGGFSTQEVDFVRHLYPHLRRAMLLRRRIGDQHSAARSLEHALHSLSTALCLLDAEGRVVFMNDAAEQAVAAGGTLRVKDGVLTPVAPADVPLWERWLASLGGGGALRGAAEGRLALRDKAGAVALHVWASPFRAPAHRLELRGAQAAIAVFLYRPGAPVVASSARLREFFRLTAAETRVLLGLVNGKAPKEIAAEAGLSADTIRAQIKSIYEKLEVHRQAELVQRVLLSPAMLVTGQE